MDPFGEPLFCGSQTIPWTDNHKTTQSTQQQHLHKVLWECKTSWLHAASDAEAGKHLRKEVLDGERMVVNREEPWEKMQRPAVNSRRPARTAAAVRIPPLISASSIPLTAVHLSPSHCYHLKKASYDMGTGMVFQLLASYLTAGWPEHNFKHLHRILLLACLNLLTYIVPG